MSISPKEEDIKTFDPQNRCINCSLLIPRNQRRHPLEQATTPNINILQSWINPTQLLPGSIICIECLELLKNCVNTMNEGNALPLPDFGHRRVCFPCGKSILRAPRTYPVRPDRQETNILLQSVPLHLVSRMERVCAACWRSATTKVQRLQQLDTKSLDLAVVVSSKDASISRPSLLRKPRQKAVSQKIISSLYRRAANTPNHCVFANCFESELLHIPSDIKDMLLYHHKFYIPSGARVCLHHLNNGSWNKLTSKLRDFTGKQFDTIMTMMQRAVDNDSNVRLSPEPWRITFADCGTYK